MIDTAGKCICIRQKIKVTLFIHEQAQVHPFHKQEKHAQTNSLPPNDQAVVKQIKQAHLWISLWKSADHIKHLV